VNDEITPFRRYFRDNDMAVYRVIHRQLKHYRIANCQLPGANLQCRFGRISNLGRDWAGRQ
jgi:hypothetical protein